MHKIEQVIQMVNGTAYDESSKYQYEVVENREQTNITFWNKSQTFSFTRMSVVKNLEEAGFLAYVSWNIVEERIELRVFWYH
jgi:hypothetical protein